MNTTPSPAEGIPTRGLTEDRAYATAFVARQPIFDTRQKVRGYELLFRDSAESLCARFADQCQATMKVIADAYVCLGPDMAGGTKIMVNFSRSGILDQLPYALPPGRTVIEFGECFLPDKDLLAALRKLKSDGYMFSLDGFHDVGGCGPLVALADIIKVDVLDQTPGEVAAILDAVGPAGPILLAKRVETAHLFEMSKAMGFTWFQGFFFQRPEIVPGRKLYSNQQSRLKLFRLIEREDLELEKVAEIIQSDVSISYRLLSLLNSAAFGLPQKVTSIERAIMMLGWKSLRNWLRVIIFTDLAPRGKTRELSFTSVLRGRFMETAAEAHHAPVSPATLFLLGLFSLLDAMLDLPMREIVTSLPIEEELKEALCGEHNIHADWAELAKCFETADWRRLDAFVEALGLDPALVAKCYHEALTWTNSFFLLNI
ncbi:EAL and HDOD domain-containing protein [Desulfolutivibrio sulfoxidireducens]|uniref:EAL and HDOD domain-containing protein n=1 Tax=Desulfolutivibrio sulfoxidireducens TaxID=2773299 RepID=UPI00159DB2D4|nr:HDOD domain-containing protein [Desulfolutivibrio sulfoxidireducens]QLA17734.1 HDOD domain-containing protein [Desulfolutivibrio sulfoxidireducens]QLA21308.1 HDOD domain-containing protein [Desulfolutivibrio sulfoxidireducens]